MSIKLPICNQLIMFKKIIIIKDVSSVFLRKSEMEGALLITRGSLLHIGQHKS